MGLGIKVWPVATLVPDVAEYNVRVHVRIEVVDALVVVLNRILEGRLVLGVGAGATSAIVADTALGAVAVDVHVD